MILLACADDDLGMMFNGRRQSQDRVLRQYILEMTGHSRLWMNAYSRKQFLEPGEILTEEACLARAGQGEFCFVEDLDPAPYRDRIEKIILFRWNRSYPADVYFDRSLLEGRKLTVAEEFPGSSHEKITREDYL